MYTWHVHKTEKFRYPINDVILKCGKELVKTVLVSLSCKINGTFNHKTFNSDHIRLTSSKHTRSLAAEDERSRTMKNESKRLILFWLSFYSLFGAWKIVGMIKCVYLNLNI